MPRTTKVDPPRGLAVMQGLQQAAAPVHDVADLRRTWIEGEEQC
jgi:hypothetical protein